MKISKLPKTWKEILEQIETEYSIKQISQEAQIDKMMLEAIKRGELVNFPQKIRKKLMVYYCFSMQDTLLAWQLIDDLAA